MSVPIEVGLGSPGRVLLCCRITRLDKFPLQQDSGDLGKLSFLSIFLLLSISKAEVL